MLIEQGDGVGFHDLMAWVGRLLLQWGNFEVRLASVQLDSQSRAALSDRVDFWLDGIADCDLSGANKLAIKADLCAIYRMRNHIAHGLVGCNADPLNASGPYLTCDSNGQSGHAVSHVEFTFSEVRGATERLANVRSVMDHPRRLISWPDHFH